MRSRRLRSHFDRRDAIQAVAGLLPEGAPGAEVERLADAYLASEAVIQIAESAKGPRYTTRRIWELEREALAAVERMRGAGGDSGRRAGRRPRDPRPPDPEGRPARDGPPPAHRPRGSRRRDRRGGHRQDLSRSSPRPRAGRRPGSSCAPRRRPGERPTSCATRACRRRRIASLLVELDRSRASRRRGAGAGVGPADRRGGDGRLGDPGAARLPRRAAEAKLVLLGDPEQLGRSRRAACSGAVADRADPIHLDEVIRHEHELDRDAAKRIREGEGREALAPLRSEERVTVAPDAEARREAMVRDWHRVLRARRGRGDDRQAKRRGRRS